MHFGIELVVGVTGAGLCTQPRQWTLYVRLRVRARSSAWLEGAQSTDAGLGRQPDAPSPQVPGGPSTAAERGMRFHELESRCGVIEVEGSLNADLLALLIRRVNVTNGPMWGQVSSSPPEGRCVCFAPIRLREKWFSASIPLTDFGRSAPRTHKCIGWSGLQSEEAARAASVPFSS